MKSSTAVVFDLDGVLWDSSAIHEAAYRQVLRPIGIELPSYEELAGRRTDEAIAWLLERNGIAASTNVVARLKAAKQAAARESLQGHPPLVPRCAALLRELADGFRLALASSSSRGNVDIFLGAVGGAGLFEAVICGDEVAHAKPAPDIYRQMLTTLRSEPDQAVVVEDSIAGIQAARAAGVATIGLQGTHAASKLRAAGATVVFESLDAVVAHVAAHY